MGKGIVYSIGTEDCPCCGCQERAVGCHGTCEKYKAWDGKRQAEKLGEGRRKALDNNGCCRELLFYGQQEGCGE